jgi:hypothetical protein
MYTDNVGDNAKEKILKISVSFCRVLRQKMGIKLMKIKIAEQAGRNYTRAYLSHTCACENHTLRVKITLERVKITLFEHNLHSCVLKSHLVVYFEKISVP